MTEVIEVLKAVALYLTPLAAVVGVFATAWLAQRNWATQFASQYHLTLLQERMKICQEVPDQLFQAQIGFIEAWGYQAYLHALGKYVLELKGIGIDPDPLIGHFREQSSAAMSLPRNAFKEMLRMLVRVEIYFGPEAVLALREVAKLLQQASLPGDEFRVVHEQAVSAFGQLVEEAKAGKIPDFSAAVFALCSQTQNAALPTQSAALGKALAELVNVFRDQLLPPGERRGGGAGPGKPAEPKAAPARRGG
jgi:hypothetical protein